LSVIPESEKHPELYVIHNRDIKYTTGAITTGHAVSAVKLNVTQMSV